ncbi:hypothetical protein BJ508DRAFT_310106 [Ascobolus immersus RN42]|uniref:Uncharacterized protein n=1 Tax=Ascobolus immersus RN42 TaxID=1160509 RepID=A0A3N4HUL2_ASCIM|nr:hypothetical protein BJ508DRAFT_310106 [Ascobolus immersus RN42]
MMERHKKTTPQKTKHELQGQEPADLYLYDTSPENTSKRVTSLQREKEHEQRECPTSSSHRSPHKAGEPSSSFNKAPPFPHRDPHGATNQNGPTSRSSPAALLHPHLDSSPSLVLPHPLRPSNTPPLQPETH